MYIAKTPEQVSAWFDAHPDAKAKIESTEIQTKIGADPCYRKMTVADVRFISVNGWYDEPGLFAWFYPCGIPNYMCVEEPPAIKWPEDREYRSPETFQQMRARHDAVLDGLSGNEWCRTLIAQSNEKLEAMWDDEFARDCFIHEMFNVEYGYARDDGDVLQMFGYYESSDYRRGIAWLGLPERICKAYESAARYVIGCNEN